MGTVRKERKVYIEGVRKVSWDTGEMCEFASSFVSAMNSLGEDIPYDYVMGTSGVAFRFTLNPGEWDFGNYSIRNIAPDLYAPIRRAFAAAGYACTLYEPGSFQDDAAKIMDSIDRGCPGAGISRGWALRLLHSSPATMKAVRCCSAGAPIKTSRMTTTSRMTSPDTSANPAGTRIIPVHLDRCKGRPPSAARRLPGCAEMGRLSDAHAGNVAKATGLEGLRVWAEEMTQEKYFPAGDDAVLGQRYVSAAINMTMLRDHCLAEPFLRRAARMCLIFNPSCPGQRIVTPKSRLRDGMDDLIADNFSPACHIGDRRS